MKNWLNRLTLPSTPVLAWGLFLLAILVVLVVAGGILASANPGGGIPWATPAVLPATPTAVATPGWWENPPTPKPLVPGGRP